MANIHSKVQDAQNATQLPEVEEAMQVLAKHGLGVFVPHMHGEQGDFIPLPKGKVIFESGLQITFEDDDSPMIENGEPIAWRWDEDADVVARCGYCHVQTCI